jgi:ATP-dependent Clp protease ATP-binding subunit ClpA
VCVVGVPGAGDFLIGREAELAVLAELVSPAPPAPALLLTGEPGTGKTALWEAGLEYGSVQPVPGEVASQAPSAYCPWVVPG